MSQYKKNIYRNFKDHLVSEKTNTDLGKILLDLTYRELDAAKNFKQKVNLTDETLISIYTDGIVPHRTILSAIHRHTVIVMQNLLENGNEDPMEYALVVWHELLGAVILHFSEKLSVLEENVHSVSLEDSEKLVKDFSNAKTPILELLESRELKNRIDSKVIFDLEKIENYISRLNLAKVSIEGNFFQKNMARLGAGLGEVTSWFVSKK